MHIPSSMLHGSICPVTAAVSAVGVVTASYLAYRRRQKPNVQSLAGVTSMIFAVQMLNFPVSHGTSGHLLAGVIASSILGVPFAILSMTIVLSIQAVFFADGGINTLGANILNMGLIGAGLGGGLLYTIRKTKVNATVALALSSWLSVVLAAMACSIELGLARSLNFEDVFASMVGIHALIGLGEALGSVVLVFLLAKSYATRGMMLALAAVVLSPLSSHLPDGLTWVLSHRVGYSTSVMRLSVVSQITTALTGGFLVFSVSFIFGKIIQLISLNRGKYVGT